MIVRLKRDFFLGGSLFKASRFGAEIPDEIAGKPVVTFDSKKKEGAWVLPADAEVLKQPLSEPPQKTAQTTFSEMANKVSKPKTFVEAMDDDI